MRGRFRSLQGSDVCNRFRRRSQATATTTAIRLSVALLVALVVCIARREVLEIVLHKTGNDAMLIHSDKNEIVFRTCGRLVIG